MDRRDRPFSYRYRGVMRFVFTLFAIGLGLAFFYFLSLLGPKKIDPDSLDKNRVNEESAQLLAQSEDYEQQFEDVAGLRKANSDDLGLLAQAIDFQKQYLRALGGSDRIARERFERLDKLYQNHVAEGLLVESIEFEREAMQHAKSEQQFKALKPFRKALEIQKTIDLDYPQSKARNIARTTRLEREVLRLKGLPIYQKSIQAEENARKAIAAEDWEQAKVEYRNAIEGQKILNMDYQGLQYADLNRLKAMKTDLDSLRSSSLHSEIEALVSAGKAKEATKDYREAADLYRKASRKQNQLNKEFENSRFALVARLDQLEQMVQMALSQKLGQAIVKDVKQLDAFLKKRMSSQGVEIINGLYPKIERFKETFPQSKILGETLLEKLQYLSLIQSAIAFFQNRIYEQLIPLPGNADVQMLKSEVSQAFYLSIALSNPSRNKGERRPADSITFFEAIEFCQKVSWLLARPVRLPNKDEFLTAVGSLPYVQFDTIAWFAENSGGSTHAIATKAENSLGFYDLLGNVEEWLDSSDILEREEAYIAGGNAEVSIDKLMDIPVAITNARSRNRMTGFRFVVEVTE